MEWEMVALSNGPSKLMSLASWTKLTSGSPTPQDLALIKAEVDAAFETLLRSKYGDTFVSIFRRHNERPLLMQFLRDEIKALYGGAGRDGTEFKNTVLYVPLLKIVSPSQTKNTHNITHYRLNKKVQVLGLDKASVLKVTPARAFSNIPKDILKAIEYGVLMRSDLQFWKEYAQVHGKVLFEEDRLGMAGVEAQKRITRNS